MITDSEMRTLTLWHHVLMMAKVIPEMKTFPEYYLNTREPHQRELIEQFEKDRITAADELAEMMEKDQ